MKFYGTTDETGAIAKSKSLGRGRRYRAKSSVDLIFVPLLLSVGELSELRSNREKERAEQGQLRRLAENAPVCLDSGVRTEGLNGKGNHVQGIATTPLSKRTLNKCDMSLTNYALPPKTT